MPAKQNSKRNVKWGTILDHYAERKGIERHKAAKALRAKVRNAYGKNATVTRFVDAAGKDNRDGNRYGNATRAEAKAILSL